MARAGHLSDHALAFTIGLIRGLTAHKKLKPINGKSPWAVIPEQPEK